ncbi:MAG: hypothetical protein PVI90_15935, partial [Desulfobacteraceae bacterium]
IATIEHAGYENLAKMFHGEYAYSYVYDGQFGELDHALANTTLARQVTGTTIWHINSDEPPILDYTTRYKQTTQQELFEENGFRSSDHDPVIIGLDLGAVGSAPVCSDAYPSYDLLWPSNRKFVPVKIQGISDSNDKSVIVTVTDVMQDEPVGKHKAPDAVIKMGAQCKLRAERDGKLNGRVYHVSFTAEDKNGNTCTGKVTVGVPLKRNTTPVDDGGLYNSTILP